MEEQIDFMNWGARCAKSQAVSLAVMAEEIEKEYGINARMEFEVGVSNCVSRYSYFNYIRNIEEIKKITQAANIEDAYLEQQKPKTYTESEIKRK